MRQNLSMIINRELGSRVFTHDCSLLVRLYLVTIVGTVHLLCLLQAQVALAQGTTSSGDSYVNSLVTSGKSTSFPALPRNIQSTLGKPTELAVNVASSTPSNSLSTSTSPSGQRQLAQQASLPVSQLSPEQQQQIQKQQSPQTRSLKFTLIAGKFWKFNIKTNSLQTRHREKELRLHSNVSAKNFIIDDDGWFQYNQQQQQLFAWPNLSVKPATYYFVLLPSGIDYEAGGENSIDINDVVANIVVELIRPYSPGTNGASSRLDIDQLIDHKFSLDHLKRHSAYPLLLSQIVSVFDSFARTNWVAGEINPVVNIGGTQTASSLTTAVTPRATATVTPATTSMQQQTATTNSILTALQQSKQARLQSNRLVEFLLIDSSASTDGEFFSITWTTQPTLINNTIISEYKCRLSTINETVSKLSSRSILYPGVDDKFVISYSLEGPLANTQSIIPTERGNYALKLSLLNSCRNKSVLEELGVTSSLGFPADVDNGDNSIPDHLIAETAPISSSADLSSPKDVRNVISSVRSSIDLQDKSTERPDFAEQQDRPTTEGNEPATSNTPPITAVPAITATSALLTTLSGQQEFNSKTTTSNNIVPSPYDNSSQSTAVQSSSSSINPPVHLIETTTPTQVSRAVEQAITQSSAAANDHFTSIPAFEPSRDALNSTQTNTRRALESTASPSPTLLSPISDFQNPQLNYLHPQTKSFANFLDMQPVTSQPNSTMLQAITTPTSNASITITSIPSGTPSNSISSTTIATTPASNPIPNASKSGQETSLNDDLIGILNGIMELLESVAIPLSVILGIILIACILIAICNLCSKKRKSKQFEVSDRFQFRYGSERKMFLKNRSKPVILEADQKSLSMGGTPQHQPLMKPIGGERDIVKNQEQASKSDRKSLSMGGTPQHQPLMKPIGEERDNVKNQVQASKSGRKPLSMGGTAQYKPVMTSIGGDRTFVKNQDQASKKKREAKSYASSTDGNNFFAMSLFSGSDCNGAGDGHSSHGGNHCSDGGAHSSGGGDFSGGDCGSPGATGVSDPA